MEIKTKLVSSLEKCFLDSDINSFKVLSEEKIFKNQNFSFQLFCQAIDNEKHRIIALNPVIESDISDFITVREVVNIPSEMPTYPHYSEGCDRTQPGLYPDLLRPLKYRGCLRLQSNQSRSLWIDINPNGKVTGKHTIKIKLYNVAIRNRGLIKDEDNFLVAEETFTIDIADVTLPEQSLIFTQWFYADCIADYYKIPVFSDEHMRICENFISTAVKNGRNMIFLPLLTYALDTYYGGERTTTQLIDVYKDGNNYTFGYDTLDKWLDMCNRCGVMYYEVSHFFSQWGADSTPKVMAYENGELKKIFGWGTNPISEEYNTFIRAFIKGFLEHMKSRGEDYKCWFHLSDEPSAAQLDQYKKVRNSVEDLLRDYNTFDALSNYEFYQQGLIKNPVPSTHNIEPFIENKVPNLWCYYCGCNYNGVSNCHFAMTLSRIRFLGTQLFKYDIKGFLHWGYNFYNNQFSYDCLDPFANSDGESFAASGDAYMVYPAPDGEAWESVRLRAMFEGMEDMRAMQLCEKLYSKEKVVEEIEKLCGKIVFSKCVYDSDTMLAVRRKINEMIFDKLS